MNKMYDEYNLYNYLNKGCSDNTIEDIERQYRDIIYDISNLQNKGINTFVDLLHLNFLTMKAIEIDRKISLMKRTTEDMKCKIK